MIVNPRQNYRRHLRADRVFLENLQYISDCIFDRIIRYEKIKANYTEMLHENSQLEALLAVSITLNHEVNNPLTSIQAVGQLMAMGKPIDPVTQKKWADIVTHNTRRIADVMRKLASVTNIKKTEYVDGTEMIDLGCAPMSTTSLINGNK